MRTLENCERRCGAKNQRCGICGKPITREPNLAWRDVPVIVDEEKVSNFRGDDIVKFYHPECVRMEKVDDDHFTWWYDEDLHEPGAKNMSTFEIAQAAWNEAVKRMISIQKG